MTPPRPIEPTGNSRGRRTPRPSGDDRQTAILATAERLLEDRPLSEISIGDLARGAGISRPTFYFYFASKDAVLLELLDRIVEQGWTAAGDVLDRLVEDPRTRWRNAISAFYETFRAHRAAVLAYAQLRSTNAEARHLWATVMEGWVHATATAIEAERERGAAPPGLPARDLAVALISMNERVMYATFADDGPAVAEPNVVDVLLSIWLSSIYQTALTLPGRNGGPATRISSAGSGGTA
jgi:TetR/AcrR family transcriptional regulator, ethionamide resistance regulator